MEEAGYSETTMSFYQFERRQTPEDSFEMPCRAKEQ
jgi:hypothetical protein